MSAHSNTFIIAALIVLIGNVLAVGDWKEDARAIDISGGEDHTLVLTKNGYVWACGDNYYYQLGIGSNVSKWTLVRVAKGGMDSSSDFLENIDDVDAGWTHSLALDVNGLICAWGRNREGQLGDNQRSGYESLAPVRVRGVDDEDYLDDIVAISAGRSGLHSLAVDANGYAYGWGYNKYGQCGNDQNDCNEWTPVYVHQGAQPDDLNDPNDWLKHIIDICAGADQSIAVEKDDPSNPNFNGCVYTWGTNRWGDDPWDVGIVLLGYGLLGTASDVNLSDTPVKVLAGAQHPNDPNQHLKHIVAVAAGWDHCMALEKDDPYDPNIYNPAYTGRVFTWGNNGPGWGGGTAVGWERSVGGRLGNGTYTDSNVPVLVVSGEQAPGDPNSPLEHIIAISAGEGHSMALDVNGYVYCWGDNQYGQLGNGRNEPCSAPVRVIAGMQNAEEPNSPLSRIVAISAGHWHSLAVDSDGVVWVWGKTKDGRLGLADMAYADPCVCAVPHRIPVVYDYNDGGVGKGFAFSIEDAINDANEGDVLEASWGIYYENVTFGDESITLKSEDPEDPEVVAYTIVDARYNAGGGINDYYRAVDFNNGSGSTLAGLTLRNAAGGGVLCENVNSVTIVNCSIQNNEWHGIWLNASSAGIQNCEIRANTSDETYDSHGVYCISGSDVNIANCVIADNDGNGISCKDSILWLTNSMIEDNADHGIYELNTTVASVIANNIVRGNADNGVFSGPFSSGPRIKNNWIYSNGGNGIETYNPVNPPLANAVIVNNTIVNNDANGVKSDYAADVNITNCIIWDNGTNELYAGDSETFDVTYSCIEVGYTGTGNITSDPCFINADENDFHLDANSLCIDAGDPGFEADANETDIDGEGRVKYGRVDIGADEYYWSPADFNGDQIVNFIDYAIFANAWMSHPGDPNWNPDCNIGIPANNRIDYNDLAVFCEDWLWQSAWDKPAGFMMMGQGMGEAGGAAFAAAEISLQSISAEQQIEKVSPLKIEQLIKWLEQVWLEEETQKLIDEDLWLKFIESLKEDL